MLTMHSLSRTTARAPQVSTQEPGARGPDNTYQGGSAGSSPCERALRPMNKQTPFASPRGDDRSGLNTSDIAQRAFTNVPHTANRFGSGLQGSAPKENCPPFASTSTSQEQLTNSRMSPHDFRLKPFVQTHTPMSSEKRHRDVLPSVERTDHSMLPMYRSSVTECLAGGLVTQKRSADDACMVAVELRSKTNVRTEGHSSRQAAEAMIETSRPTSDRWVAEMQSHRDHGETGITLDRRVERFQSHHDFVEPALTASSTVRSSSDQKPRLVPVSPETERYVLSRGQPVPSVYVRSSMSHRDSFHDAPLRDGRVTDSRAPLPRGSFPVPRELERSHSSLQEPHPSSLSFSSAAPFSATQHRPARLEGHAERVLHRDAPSQERSLVVAERGEQRGGWEVDPHRATPLRRIIPESTIGRALDWAPASNAELTRPLYRSSDHVDARTHGYRYGAAESGRFEERYEGEMPARASTQLSTFRRVSYPNLTVTESNDRYHSRVSTWSTSAYMRRERSPISDQTRYCCGGGFSCWTQSKDQDCEAERLFRESYRVRPDSIAYTHETYRRHSGHMVRHLDYGSPVESVRHTTGDDVIVLE